MRSAVETIEMSDYLKSLREAEQARYVAKLEEAGLSLQDDPYASTNDHCIYTTLLLHMSLHMQ